MSVAPDLSTARHWLLPTCGQTCRPGNHDPLWHEAVGMRVALMTPPATVVRTGSLVVDLRRRAVTVVGEPVHLSVREWELLAHLALNVERRCPMHEVLGVLGDDSWPARTAKRAAAATMTMGRLRAKLGVAAYLIDTVKNGGYRLRLEPQL